MGCIPSAFQVAGSSQGHADYLCSPSLSVFMGDRAMLIPALQAVVKIRDFTDFQGACVTPWNSSHSVVYSSTHLFLRRIF